MADSFDIYLASQSPRRRALLEQIGVRYRQLPVAIPEVPGPDEAPEMYVLRLALEKARAGLSSLGPAARAPVLGADTAVVVDGKVLGKPRDREDALAMLALLSARWHQVFSAVAVVAPDGEARSRLNVSNVLFREIGRAEAEAYWQTGEPADKAGSYAIQGHAAVFVERLEGSCSGVTGLPLFETAELLEQLGVLLPGRSV